MFLYTCYYAFPQTDDFCTFGRLLGLHGDNPFVEMSYLYMNWTGRYTSSLLTSAVGWLYSFTPWPIYWTYETALAVLMIAFYISCSVASSIVLKDKLWNRSIAALICTLCLVTMPSKVEGLYWLTGAVVYVAGTTIFMFTAALLEAEVRNERAYIFGRRSLLAVVAIFWCVGVNELVAVSLGVYLVLQYVLVARGYIYRRKNILFFVTYIIAMCITLVAPGNFKRNATLQVGRHDLPQAIDLAAGSLNSFGKNHIFPNVEIIGATLLCCLLIGYFRSSWKYQYKRVIPLVATLVLSFPLSLVIYSFLTGQSTPGRVYDQNYPMLLIGLCLICLSWGRRLAARGMVSSKYSGFGYSALFIVGVVFLSSQPMLALSANLRDFAPVWRSEQIKRHQLLNSTDSKAVIVSPFRREKDDWPILQGSDVSSDPSYWINRCVAGFYGLQSIRLKDTP